MRNGAACLPDGSALLDYSAVDGIVEPCVPNLSNDANYRQSNNLYNTQLMLGSRNDCRLDSTGSGMAPPTIKSATLPLMNASNLSPNLPNNFDRIKKDCLRQGCFYSTPCFQSYDYTNSYADCCDRLMMPEVKDSRLLLNSNDLPKGYNYVNFGNGMPSIPSTSSTKTTNNICSPHLPTTLTTTFCSGMESNLSAALNPNAKRDLGNSSLLTQSTCNTALSSIPQTRVPLDIIQSVGAEQQLIQRQSSNTSSANSTTRSTPVTTEISDPRNYLPEAKMVQTQRAAYARTTAPSFFQGQRSKGISTVSGNHNSSNRAQGYYRNSHLPVNPKSSLGASRYQSGAHISMNNHRNQLSRTSITMKDGMKDVPGWLKSLRLHKYTEMFQMMDYDEMMKLDEEKLEALAVTAGARRKITQHVQKLRERIPELKALYQQMEKNPGGIRDVIKSLRAIIITPIRPFIAAINVGKYPMKCDTNGLYNEDLPSHIVWVAMKVSRTILENPYLFRQTLDDDSYGELIATCDRIVAHEAFTPAHKEQIIMIKNQLRRLQRRFDRRGHSVNEMRPNNNNRPIIRTPPARIQGPPLPVTGNHIVGNSTPGIPIYQPMPYASTAFLAGLVQACSQSPQQVIAFWLGRASAEALRRSPELQELMSMSPAQFQQMATVFKRGAQANTLPALSSNGVQAPLVSANLPPYTSTTNPQRSTNLQRNNNNISTPATTTSIAPLQQCSTPPLAPHPQIPQQRIQAQTQPLRQMHYPPPPPQQQPCLQTNINNEWKRDYVLNGQMKTRDTCNVNDMCRLLNNDHISVADAMTTGASTSVATDHSSTYQHHPCNHFNMTPSNLDTVAPHQQHVYNGTSSRLGYISDSVTPPNFLNSNVNNSAFMDDIDGLYHPHWSNAGLSQQQQNHPCMFSSNFEGMPSQPPPLFPCTASTILPVTTKAVDNVFNAAASQRSAQFGGLDTPAPPRFNSNNQSDISSNSSDRSSRAGSPRGLTVFNFGVDYLSDGGLDQLCRDVAETLNVRSERELALLTSGAATMQ